MKSAKKSSPKKPVRAAKKNLKIGIFGGTFDPFHNGHLNSIKTVLDKMKFDQFLIVPTYQSPHRPVIEGPTPEQRLEMVMAATQELDERVQVESFEVDKKGTSFTIETLNELQKRNKSAEFYLVIGSDQFESFDRWRNFQDIIKKVNVVVTSRPNSTLIKSKKDFPVAIQKLVETFRAKKGEFTSGKTLSFIQLKDVDVSATEIRRRFRAKEAVADLISESVEKFIRSQGLYESLGARIGDFEKFTIFCSQILKEKNGIQVLAYDLRSLQQPSEFTVVCSGTSTRQTQSLAESVMKAVKDQYGVWPQSVEGQKEGRWVVIDYGSLIVHLFYDYVRNEYRLEQLWRDAEELPLPKITGKLN